MLESYDDSGGWGATIIILVGLIAYTIAVWNAYPPDKECKDKQYSNRNCIECMCEEDVDETE